MAKFQADARAGRVKLQPGIIIDTAHPRMGIHIDGAQVEYNFLPLIDLIAAGYGVKTYQISGPAWITGQRFDIEATMPTGATVDDAPAMLQNLLENRFKIAIHREAKDRQVLALVVAKGGPKLKESPASLPPIDVRAPGPYNPSVMYVSTPDGPVRLTNNVNTTLESNKITMENLADLLSRLLIGGSSPTGRELESPEYGGDWKAVVDRTGLQGDYEITLQSSKVMPAVAQLIQSPFQESGGAIPDLLVFSSVQKLGLKLEVGKARLEMLVVDHADKTPTPN